MPEVPAALVAALEAGLRGDRRQRPAAAEFAAMVYRSAQAEPVDLSVSVHPTVIPQLLTRRDVQPGPCRRWPRAPAARAQAGACGGFARTRPGQPPDFMAPLWMFGRGGPGRHRGLRTRRVPRTPARRALPLGLAGWSCWPAPGCWRRRPAPDAVAGLFPGLGPPATVFRRKQEPAVAEEGRRRPSDGPAPNRRARPTAGATQFVPILRHCWPQPTLRRRSAVSPGSVRSRSAPGTSACSMPSTPRRRPPPPRTDGSERSSSAAGHVLAGFSTVLTRIETTADSSPARAVVAITTESSAYQEVMAAGPWWPRFPPLPRSSFSWSSCRSTGAGGSRTFFPRVLSRPAGRRIIFSAGAWPTSRFTGRPAPCCSCSSSP